MSTVLLVIASVLVLAFLAWALLDNFRSQPTGADRLLLIAVLAVGGAVGVAGEGQNAVVHVLSWTIAGAFVLLAAYAKWREHSAAA
jgi:hypothetical protein